MKGKNSPENLLMEILKLDALEFLGVCKILGIEVYEKKKDVDEDVDEFVDESVHCGRPNEDTNTEETPRDFYDIWVEMVDVIGDMNRVRRKNLGKLIHPAVKKEK